MDAVILAAGKGERLNGVAAPYHKPLMVVNGVPLIAKVTKQALDWCDHVIIVVAPQNADPICAVLSAHVDFGRIGIVIQPEADGPAKALVRGMGYSDSERVLVLMADNVTHRSDIERILKAAEVHPLVIGTRLIDDKEAASRFTRITPGGNTVERPDVTEEELWPNGKYEVWCGPLVLPRGRAVIEYAGSPHGKIGPGISRINAVTTVGVDTIDIGVPQALQEVNGEAV